MLLCELMTSLGLFRTQLHNKGTYLPVRLLDCGYKPCPLLSGSTCECLGLMHFTISEDLHKVNCMPPSSLTKKQLISRYNEVFTAPRESLPDEVHFELDKTITPVQCPPRNVPIALKAAVKE